MRLAHPLVVPWIRLDRDPAAEAEVALRRAKEPWLAGFCLFGGEAEGVRRLTERLRDAAGRPIFVASDMERGAGQQVRGLRVLPDAGVWGVGATPAEVESFGEATARDARSVGVDVLFAPVLDVRSEPSNPIVGNRAFGWDPDRVAELGAAFVRGALAGGCAPTAKHWPGHGATTADSHDAVPVVAESRSRLSERDLWPFEGALLHGCPAVMTAHVAYPALDASGAIATFSTPIVAEVRAMAKSLGRRLTVFTDALLMAGALGEGGETEAARRSLRAGCDALLIPSDPERLAAELLVDASTTLAAKAEEAARGIRSLIATIGALGVPPPGSDAHLAGVSARVADRALRLRGGQGIDPLGKGDVLVVVDDDDTPDRGLVLARRGAAAGVEVRVVRMEKGVPQVPVPATVVPAVVVLMASVRAWKGTSNASQGATDLAASLVRRAAGRAQLVALTPRRGAANVHVPGTGPDVEEALADRFFGA